jgi:hypothetical protein
VRSRSFNPLGLLAFVLQVDFGLAAAAAGLRFAIAEGLCLFKGSNVNRHSSLATVGLCRADIKTELGNCGRT